MSEEAGKRVCVTGASGYIASWLVKLLLERGYTVKATARTLKDPKKIEHLLSLDGAKERLQLFEANLMVEGSFDSVVDGCEGVFHTASPVFFLTRNLQEELIGPAVKGTLNVLRSCMKVPSIKRVVITSSMASVVYKNIPLNPDVLIDETWFSDPVYCEESKLWYALSKTLAEEAAWKFVRESGIDLVTIHPGFVIGPLLQPTLNLSTEGFLNLIKSAWVEVHCQGYKTSLTCSSLQNHLWCTELFPNAIYRCVDIRDVALAHIQAFEIPSANGRYCVVGTVKHSSEIMEILHKLYPALNLPKREEGKMPADTVHQVSQKKAESLGINFTPLEVTLSDTIECFKEMNLLCF